MHGWALRERVQNGCAQSCLAVTKKTLYHQKNMSTLKFEKSTGMYMHETCLVQCVSILSERFSPLGSDGKTLHSWIRTLCAVLS